MSADKGNRNGMLRYAEMLKNGKGVDQNNEEFSRYFRMAIQQGALENAEIGCGIQ